MHGSIQFASSVTAVGIGATAVMDIWLQGLRKAGVPTQNFAMLGRWIGHISDGKWFHSAISKAAPVKGEALIGWTAHYAIGVGFAVLLICIQGPAWLAAPTVGPALLVGALTVAAPLLVLQPALGAGIASTRTASPVRNSIKSLANHLVFGFGLYVAAMTLQVVRG